MTTTPERPNADCPQPPERLLYSVNDTRLILGGLSRTSIWRMAKLGRLEKVTIGGRVFITRQSVEALLSPGTR